MNSDTQGFLTYLIAVVAFSVAAHIFIRKFWTTCLALASGCSIFHIANEAVRHDFNIRPSDLAFWIPMEFMYGALMAFPIAVLVGLPFDLIRRRRVGA